MSQIYLTYNINQNKHRVKMKKLVNYLYETKEILKKGLCKNEIHIVMGNESCDLDSTISTLLLAHLLNSNKNLLNLHEKTVVLPILNVSKTNFEYRTEICFVLKEAGILKENLIYKNDDVNLSKLIANNSITTSLVDHHILNESDKILEDTVKQIFDHRPIDRSHSWDLQKIDFNVKQVGSCSTLIAQQIIKNDAALLSKEVAYMLYETIIYDTIALLPEKGKAKELDLEIGKILEDKFEFTENRQTVFDKLWSAHNDVSHLTLKQLLYKDLKVVEGIPIPGLPMLSEDYLKLPDALKTIEEFAQDYPKAVVVLIGLNASGGGFRRDVAVYSTNDKLKNVLVAALKGSDDNFDFKEVEVNLENVVCYRQNNIKLSRKQIIPILKQAV